jgi:succinate dehydrogenase/fumarate reductase flavoprotein subunit
MATKVMDCDLVVIGAGGTGSICAVKAADLLPGKKVIVLEKAKKPGGATYLGHGPHISDSTWQRNAGAKQTETQDISGQFFDFLVSKDEAEAKKYFLVRDTTIPFPQKAGIDMPKRIDKYKDLDDASIGPGWWGTYIVDKMMECCKKMNIPVLTETKAKKLLKDSNGKVTGVIAETKDGELQVNFKACFIAAGGFGADYKKCQEVWPKVFNNIAMHNLCPPTLTGDWIEFAKEIGAGVDLKNATPNVQGPIHHPYSYTLVNMARASVMQLQVNLDGQRVTEPGGRMGQAVADSFVYSIAGQDVLEKAAEMAAEAIPEEHEHELAKNKWREDVAEEVATDEKWGWGRHTTKADTLAELAIKLNIDPLVFLATVEKYNNEVESSGDRDATSGGSGGQGAKGNKFFGQFYQGSVSPLPIKNGPFYAIFGQRFKQCTHGGIVVNDSHEVLDTNGNVMPGLYAGGDCTTEYTPSSGAQTGGQGGGPMAGGAGLFGNYTGRAGGGMQGICKGISAAAVIAKYLQRA